MLIKPYEFWNPRVFELPYYLYLGVQCLLNGVGVRGLAKANYALDHGEIGIGSKYASQLAFDQRFFLPTTLMKGDLSVEQKQALILDFAAQYGFPVILKSDVGCVGKGVVKVSSPDDVQAKVSLLLGDYIVQQFTPYPYECGIFYTRYQGKPTITGINQKHFPTVVGNGVDTLLSLAQAHYRYSHHWQSFLQYLDTERIPDKGEKVRLSFIGSHTLGCMFTDDTYLLTPELERAIVAVFESRPGFNFGRVDVKAASEDALKRGELVVIEVNGVASLPTHMFDPKFSVWRAYKIFFQHAKSLVKIAREHKRQPMALMPYKDIVRKVSANQKMLDEVHGLLKT